MKITSLSTDYIKGIIDTFIAIYSENTKILPDTLSYEINREIGANAVKIRFEWVINERVVFKDETMEETNNDLENDWFVIVIGDKITKVESYINDVLDKVPEIQY